jgi:hypothetical protein
MVLTRREAEDERGVVRLECGAKRWKWDLWRRTKVGERKEGAK